MVRVPQSSATETDKDRQYDNLEKVKRSLKAEAKKTGKKMSEADIEAAARKMQQPPGGILQALRKDQRASWHGATSCPHETKSTHTCSLVFQQTVAGYTTHTFSEDFQTLHTYIYNWEGQLLHSLSVAKGSGGGSGSNSGPQPPPPGPPSGSSSSTGGTCCKYDSTSCHAGEECCSESGNPYEKYSCERYGAKHHCAWLDGKCIVQ